MTRSAVELEARIAEAFTEAATSDDVGRLLPEVEGAASSADAVAREARTRALDPLLSRDEVNRGAPRNGRRLFQCEIG